jgi:5-formyltetrahydrofolate cyclo-ligase
MADLATGAVQPSALDERKRALRAQLQAGPRPAREQIATASTAIASRLLQLFDEGALRMPSAAPLPLGSRPAAAPAPTIAIYRALPSEVQTAQLTAALVERGARIVHPIVLQHTAVLAFRPSTGSLRRGPLGVEEPLGGPDVALSEIALFLVPGLAADLRGRRLGRGRGYYDATLRAAPHALSVMLLLESGLVPEVPVGEHDVAVDALCTEARLVVCSERAGALFGSRSG